MVRPARDSDCRVFHCDSHVTHAVTRSDGRVVLFVVSFFVTLSARSFVVARFAARSALDCWLELHLRQASLSSIANCCGQSENKRGTLVFHILISGVVTRP